MTPTLKRNLIILGILLLAFKFLGSYSYFVLPPILFIYYIFRHYDNPYVLRKSNIFSKIVALVYLSGFYRFFFNQESDKPRDGRKGNLLILVLVMTVFFLMAVAGYNENNWGLGFKGGFLIIVTYGFLALCFYANKQRIENERNRQYSTESKRHGTASFATREEVRSLLDKDEGIYVGSFHLRFPQMTHGLLCAGSGGGKGTKIIIPNLLSIGGFKGSFVVIDPKGENAAITSRIQKEKLGRKVVMLNPWGLHQLPSDSYNPLDLLVHDLNNLSDDAEMIAETIIPASQGNHAYWDDKARSILTALILHLVTESPESERHLGTIYSWLGLSQDDWFSLLADMSTNDNEFAGEIISGEANRILALMKSEKEYTSVISSLNRHMDFIKSPALRNAMKKSEGFSPADLTKKNTIVYVIIPADKTDKPF